FRTDDMLLQAGEKASAMLLRAESQIEIEKKKAVNEIKDEMADLAISAAKQVLKKEMNTADNEKLINDFIENAGDIKWQN
ncbi:MAG: ATP synthase F0 subunit B, partial [Oscillospiraceae bacterium]